MFTGGVAISPFLRVDRFGFTMSWSKKDSLDLNLRWRLLTVTLDLPESE